MLEHLVTLLIYLINHLFVVFVFFLPVPAAVPAAVVVVDVFDCDDLILPILHVQELINFFSLFSYSTLPQREIALYKTKNYNSEEYASQHTPPQTGAHKSKPGQAYKGTA